MLELPKDAFRRDKDKAESLVKRYTPSSFDELLGQPIVVKRLKQYVSKSWTCAKLFHGGTGTGKTSAAHILARELGVAVDECEFGGLYELVADRSPDDLRELVRQIHHRPFVGSGWRVVIANEADRMSRPAETLWLNILEALPTKSCIIFSTNEVHRLSQRFRDRCEEYEFDGGEKLRPWVHALATRIWENEVGQGTPPAVNFLGIGEDGISFRLAIQQLSAAIGLRRAS